MKKPAALKGNWVEVPGKPGLWRRGPDPELELSPEEFARVITQAHPEWKNELYEMVAQEYPYNREQEYNLAYAMYRQKMSMDHESASSAARELVRGRTYEDGVGPENVENRKWAVLPLESPLRRTSIEDPWGEPTVPPRVIAVADAGSELAEAEKPAARKEKKAAAAKAVTRELMRRESKAAAQPPPRMAGPQLQILASLLGAGGLAALGIELTD